MLWRLLLMQANLGGPVFSLLWFACAPEPELVTDPEIVQVAPVPVAAPAVRIDTGDLDAIEKRGVLRVLVFGDGEVVLPRDGASALTDRTLASAFAAELGLAVEPVHVERFSDLVPLLNDGKGDLIAARFARTPARSTVVAFSRPTATVSEVLVGRKGGVHPTSRDALGGVTVTVRAASSYHEALVTLPVKVVLAEEHRDTESLVHDVGTGAIAYTVCDSDLLAHIQAYNTDVEALFPITTGREIGWGLRRDNPALKAAADAFLVAQNLTAHARVRDTGDLAAAKVRGSLRMLTRNNASSYFLYKGEQHGFDYELMRRFATEQGLRLDVIVPPTADLLIPWLLEGRGDVIAAEMTATPAREALIGFSTPYLFVDEVVVQRPGTPALASPADLRGQSLAVRASSSYRATLDGLQSAFGPFSVQDLDESLDTDEILEQVAEGRVTRTVADSTLVQAAVANGLNLVVGPVLAAQRPVAFGVRKDAAALRAALSAFVVEQYRGRDYNVLKRRTFDVPTAPPDPLVGLAGVSAYDALFKHRSAQYGLDWRLMAAQAYQESRFDPGAVSFSGALGLFQVLPSTGRELGFTDLHNPDQGVHAGVMYVSRLIDRFEPELPFKQRVRFALASYNVGKGHVDDARRLAAQMGLDKDKWFGNVEKAMLELRKPAVARRTKYGFCRAEEPVRYVSEIQSRYENYLAVLPR